MKYLFHLGHPAHFHLFKNIIFSLQQKKHDIFILIKKKDILEELLIQTGLPYYNLLPKGRKDSKWGIAAGVLEADLKMFAFCRKHKPDLLIGTSISISHVGKILRIPSINVNEDDFDVVPLYSKLSYPFTSTILAPEVCRTGKWNYKAIKYPGYHELAYLHPNHFTPDQKVVEKYFPADEPYFIMRFAKLNAHHDQGIKGISSQVAEQIIRRLTPEGKIYITSERALEPQFEKYRMNINPLDIHHVLAFAQLYIGDSQTMAAEAGVLGTPFVRFNDFVGRISYLSELENIYHLGVGIKTHEVEKLYMAIGDLIHIPELKKEWKNRQVRMLKDKIDTLKFMTWFIENYPESMIKMKTNPNFYESFL
jgi:predicted glycosyltransferase